MRIGVLVALAFLAGCAGNSSFAPAVSAAETFSAARLLDGRTAAIVAAYPPFASARLNARLAERGRPVLDLRTRGFVPLGTADAAKGGAIFASDLFQGNVDVYDETTGAMRFVCVACGGFGVAVSPRTGDLAIGTLDQTVTLWHVTQKAIAQYATCRLTGNGSGADGIAWDLQGDLYAGNFPANNIDVFGAKTIARGCGAPDRTILVGALQAVYYISSVGKVLEVDGPDADFNVQLVRVDPQNGASKIQQTLGSETAQTAFPGGVDTDAARTVYVNNQFGTLSAFPDGGRGKRSGSCSWGFDPNDFTGIALDSNEDALWAANVDFAQSVLVSFGAKLSLPIGGNCNLQAQTNPPESNESYIGIAVWKRGRT